MLAFLGRQRIAILYVVFGGGGLWHFLGVLNKTMDVLSGYMISVLSVYLIYEYSRIIPVESRRKYYFWLVLVFMGSFLLEAVGVYTGWPFGDYSYGLILQPQLFMVPLSIGFAWILILLSSLSLTLAVFGEIRLLRTSPLALFLAAATFMLFFDILMEPAAIYLDYWVWHSETIPFTNYLTWFLAGFAFYLVYWFLKLPYRITPAVGVHVYLAQVLYFTLVLLR